MFLTRESRVKEANDEKDVNDLFSQELMPSRRSHHRQCLVVRLVRLFHLHRAVEGPSVGVVRTNVYRPSNQLLDFAARIYLDELPNAEALSKLFDLPSNYAPEREREKIGMGAP